MNIITQEQASHNLLRWNKPNRFAHNKLDARRRGASKTIVGERMQSECCQSECEPSCSGNNSIEYDHFNGNAFFI
jgi:hypothetical protein